MSFACMSILRSGTPMLLNMRVGLAGLIRVRKTSRRA
ncbi:hypothetical protein EV688_101290 [Chromatocurvus halotolerans]|uniref:Uncharacterized protein n=1 Tax=Chromatocurvus halotolerans TaxID=1132028 RepID=A0A4R2KX33_9GAMM|nr:hypothetical protein EV688_101290 [Chromatocurvus halotolerans]